LTVNCNCQLKMGRRFKDGVSQKTCQETICSLMLREKADNALRKYLQILFLFTIPNVIVKIYYKIRKGYRYNILII